MSQRDRPSTLAPHLDTREQHAAGLLRVRTLPADEDNSKRTRRAADALFLHGIEKRAEVTDRDLRVFIFRHAHRRGAQSPDARVVLRDRLLQRGRIGQEVLVLDRRKLRMRGGVAGWAAATREDDPWGQGTTAEIGDVTDAVVGEKSA
jgi:hypothetical protein